MSDPVPAGKDWVAWHAAYQQPNSGMSWRLGIVQGRIRAYLGDAAPGPIRAISLCAGQGLDLIGALERHPRAEDVTARLVELDPYNADAARLSAQGAGLRGVEVVTGDASDTSAYRGAVPAQLVLACGIFGNISDSDIRTTVSALPGLCAPEAVVIWTRHRREPDLTPQIRRWFQEAGFEEVGFDAHPVGVQSVGACRLARPPDPYRAGVKLFTFVGYDRLG